jgi:GMP synthase-like glutamine amidotransferase
LGIQWDTFFLNAVTRQTYRNSMKPVAIFCYSPGKGPGHFATFLARHSIPFVQFKLDEGDALPASIDAYSGLCFMGGIMSVNDEDTWIAQLQTLIASAVAADKPVIGHCFGGQLLAKTLGGTVTRNPVKEIGWIPVRVLDQEWLPDTTDFIAYEWHGETFSLPPGAHRLLESDHCDNQAFALGPHLGMQCHVEMTEAMVEEWSAQGTREIERALEKNAAAPVQRREQQLAPLQERIAALHGIADKLYAKWVKGLKH